MKRDMLLTRAGVIVPEEESFCGVCVMIAAVPRSLSLPITEDYTHPAAP